jgi:hypothetical protein
MNKCDKCHSDILMGRCSCGEWFESEEYPDRIKNIEKAILDFNASGKDISSSDHHTGSCVVFFKGSFKKCMIVVDLIEKLNKLESQFGSAEFNKSQVIIEPEQ